MSEQVRYKAFLSYSSVDQPWAERLHKELESYRVPKELVGRPTAYGPIPASLFPIFRDRDDLASSPDLSDEITRALECSDCLIVICSPHAVASLWVNNEILAFKRLGRESRIFAYVVDGEPNAANRPGINPQSECLPKPLRFKMGASGALTDEPILPLAADRRSTGDGEDNAKLKILAGLFGVGFDELKQREREAERRRAKVRVAVSGAVFLLAASGKEKFTSGIIASGVNSIRFFGADQDWLLVGSVTGAVWRVNVEQPAKPAVQLAYPVGDQTLASDVFISAGPTKLLTSVFNIFNPNYLDDGGPVILWDVGHWSSGTQSADEKAAFPVRQFNFYRPGPAGSSLFASASPLNMTVSYDGQRAFLFGPGPVASLVALQAYQPQELINEACRRVVMPVDRSDLPPRLGADKFNDFISSLLFFRTDKNARPASCPPPGAH